MELGGKVVLITGASGGIGLAAVRAFAEAGAKVAMAARSGDKLEQVADELRRKGREVLVITADVSQKVEVERMVEETYRHFGRLDILVNNAGQAASGTIATVNNDNFRAIIELNVFGPLNAMQAAVAKMRQDGGGVIINISSMVTKLRIPTIGVYAATKAALNMLSHTARVELAADNIRVVTVYPGLTDTNFNANTLKEGGTTPNMAGGRGDSPEKVAAKIVEAAIKEPRDQYMSFGAKVFGTVGTLFPNVIDRAISRRMSSRARQSVGSPVSKS